MIHFIPAFKRHAGFAPHGAGRLGVLIAHFGIIILCEMRYTSQRGLGYTHFMRKIFFLILVAVLINPVAAVRAQEETKASDSAADTGGTAQKKIGKKRNYTTFDTEESQQKTETSKSGNGKSTSGSGAGTQTCTDHARAKAEEYDKLMIAYYEDSQLIAQNQQKLETTKRLRNFRKTCRFTWISWVPRITRKRCNSTSFAVCRCRPARLNGRNGWGCPTLSMRLRLPRNNPPSFLLYGINGCSVLFLYEGLGLNVCYI